MKSKSKSENHEEFLRLMKEMENRGFRPAEVARKLRKTNGAMTQYASGDANPSDTVLELLRRIVSETCKYDPNTPDNLIIPVRAGETESQFRNALVLKHMKQGPGGGRSGRE